MEMIALRSDIETNPFNHETFISFDHQRVDTFIDLEELPDLTIHLFFSFDTIFDCWLFGSSNCLCLVLFSCLFYALVRKKISLFPFHVKVSNCTVLLLYSLLSHVCSWGSYFTIIRNSSFKNEEILPYVLCKTSSNRNIVISLCSRYVVYHSVHKKFQLFS